MRQPNNRRRLLVKLTSILLIVAIYAGHIDEHINQLGADLIVLHVHRCRVSGNVDLGDHIEQEGLLDLASID